MDVKGSRLRSCHSTYLKESVVEKAIVFLLLRLHIMVADKPFVPENTCTVPVVSIPCSGSWISEVRFYYDIYSSNCSKFDYYPNCSSSENNFLTYDLCVRSCVIAVQPTPVTITSTVHAVLDGTFLDNSFFASFKGRTLSPISSFSAAYGNSLSSVSPLLSSTQSSTVSIVSQTPLLLPNTLSTTLPVSYSTLNDVTNPASINNSNLEKQYIFVLISLGVAVFLVSIILVIILAVSLYIYKLRKMTEQLSDSCNTECGHTRNFMGAKELHV